MGKLSATLAHEIRNPLSALKLNLNYLKMSEEEFDPEVIECLNSCVEAADRIQDLIENTLEFSRTPTRDDKEVNINEVTVQAIDILMGTAKKKNVDIISDLDEKLPHIIFNRNKILQVFINLITNAIDASERNSMIKLRSYQNSKKDVIFEVEDNGVGIGEDAKEKVFMDFYTSKRSGTGLGLSVCKKLLEEYDCEIDFESAENKGTTFKILFPKKTTK